MRLMLEQGYCGLHTFPGEQPERYRGELERLAQELESARIEWLMVPAIPDNYYDWSIRHLKLHTKQKVVRDALAELEAQGAV